MTQLPPQVQTLVDQMRQTMGWQAWPVCSIEIHLDREGIAQDVKPTLSYRRGKQGSERLESLKGGGVVLPRLQPDIHAPFCCDVSMSYDVITAEYVCGFCGKKVDKRAASASNLTR